MPTVILPTRNGAKAAYTFTFDDGGDGQYKYAVPILSSLGLTGTFFLIGASVRSWYQGPQKFHVPQMLNALASGHEIGNHTYNHADVDTDDQDQIRAQIGQCQDFLAGWGVQSRSIAYPHGAFSETTLDVAQEYVSFGRTVGPYMLNSFEWEDKNQLAVRVASGASDDTAAIQAAIDAGKWYISVFHLINESGFTPQRFSALAEWVAAKKDANELWVDTFGGIMQYLKQRHDATVVETTPSANQIRVALTMSLPNDFVIPLTLKTDVSGRPEIASIVQSGMSLDFRMEGGCVIYDVIPNGGSVDIVFVAGSGMDP
jgi:peptidoglycan/xylan/chitin deacetylase (PgdA/CDA1 family)